MNSIKLAIATGACALLVILLTVIFESIYHDLLHRASHTSKFYTPVLKTLMRQLSILGFISLFVFTLTRSGYTKPLNDYIFGEDILEEVAVDELRHHHEPEDLAPTTLSRLFGRIHSFIFILLCSYIVNFGIILARQRQMYSGFKIKDVDSTRGVNRGSYSTARQLFFNPDCPSMSYRPLMADAFDFPLYLGETLCATMIEFADIPPVVYLTLFLSFVVFVPLISSFSGLAVIDNGAFTVVLPFVLALVDIMFAVWQRSTYISSLKNLHELTKGEMEDRPYVIPVKKGILTHFKGGFVDTHHSMLPLLFRKSNGHAFFVKMFLYYHILLAAIVFHVSLGAYFHSRLLRVLPIPYVIYGIQCLAPLIIILVTVFIIPDMLIQYTYHCCIEQQSDKAVVRKVDRWTWNRSSAKMKKIVNQLCFKEVVNKLTPAVICARKGITGEEREDEQEEVDRSASDTFQLLAKLDAGITSNGAIFLLNVMGLRTFYAQRVLSDLYFDLIDRKQVNYTSFKRLTKALVTIDESQSVFDVFQLVDEDREGMYRLCLDASYNHFANNDGIIDHTSIVNGGEQSRIEIEEVEASVFIYTLSKGDRLDQDQWASFFDDIWQTPASVTKKFQSFQMTMKSIITEDI